MAHNAELPGLSRALLYLQDRLVYPVLSITASAIGYQIDERLRRRNTETSPARRASGLDGDTYLGDSPELLSGDNLRLRPCLLTLICIMELDLVYCFCQSLADTHSIHCIV